jgi:hypothetical protein
MKKPTRLDKPTQQQKKSARHLDKALPKDKVKDFEEEIKLHETYGGD